MILNEKAVVYIPDGIEPHEAFGKTTCLAISAHQDDIEIMAQHGILRCYENPDEGFSALVVTDGAGSPRTGAYAHYTDEEMMRERQEEQKRAANLGKYRSLTMLNYPSSSAKKAGDQQLLDDLCEVIRTMRPQVIYTHNPADKHLTHVGVAIRVIEALRRLPQKDRPQKLYGCEVWRALDWVNDDEKIALDLTGQDALRADLLKVFASQIAGGKRYDLATLGRQAANATFYASHDVDHVDAASYVLDLTELMLGGEIIPYVQGYIQRFAQDVANMIGQVGGI